MDRSLFGSVWVVITYAGSRQIGFGGPRLVTWRGFFVHVMWFLWRPSSRSLKTMLWPSGDQSGAPRFIFQGRDWNRIVLASIRGPPRLGWSLGFSPRRERLLLGGLNLHVSTWPLLGTGYELPAKRRVLRPRRTAEEGVQRLRATEHGEPRVFAPSTP